ncbi:MAG: DUF6273 domain-containing protein [Clostridiales bacterium]|nr:DUF6273 domain-containing protein [Clostridiales bacterium]
MDESELIKILAEKGALGCLKDAITKPDSEREIAVKRAVSKLPRFLNSDEANDMLYSFAAALGWKITKPQQAVNAQQTVMPRPQPPQAVDAPQKSAASGTLGVNPAIGSVHNLDGIDWRVLSVENNKALLISERILEKRPYNVEWKDITWENCTLRKYLNGEFLNKLGAVKSAIAETRNANPNNTWYGAAGGNATTDKVFLLSLYELVKYFGDSGDLANKRRKDNSGDVDINGWSVNDQYNSARMSKYGNEASWWWLRSPGFYGDTAARVYTDGAVYVSGRDVNNGTGGVRPALWLNL